MQQAVPLGTDDETLVSGQEESCTIATICFNIRWTGFTMLMLIWILFTALQIIKNNTVVCGLEYWILSVLQVLVMDRLNIISSK
ncbi:sulfite exporter TauE/SafE family protein 4 [Cryptomeria japonica]|uniref:sulfite exporter TauE/SafE family protein 4 n=1 Tax=Cryptomeria japonica TaxID=3369 RepID=UPI0027DA659A|nr:sulfite exporter TauE/SafE family protein 4 [Cryptomeria japonica]